MNTDLTCPECEGSGMIRLGTEERGDDLACLRCGGVGRRSFTMREWDALVAERDRLLEVAKAANDYLVEHANPAPDYIMRTIARERLAAAIANLEGGV